MFLGLLNRVKVDLVSTVLRACLSCGVQLTGTMKAKGGDRPSFCASLIHNPDRGCLSEIEMAFLAGQL